LASNGRSNSRNWESRAQAASERPSSSVLDLKGENYFSCAVGRKWSSARHLLNSSEEVVSFLKELATASGGF
jgi:trehalose 6-phosphate synthase/phosphatase